MPTSYAALCEDDRQTPAPRPTCRCRECYRTRERSIDPRLIAMVNERGGFRILPSREIIHRILEAYCMGRLEWASLHFEIITALATHAEEVFDRQLQMARLSLNLNMTFGPGKQG